LQPYDIQLDICQKTIFSTLHTHVFTPPWSQGFFRRWVFLSWRFDATLGFPGEGPPVKIATYNINGAKTKLNKALHLARQAKIDALLVQEMHYYEDGYHARVTNLAKHRGWTAFIAHDSHRDPRGGTAIFIRTNSESITLPKNATPTAALRGRAISIECYIKGVKTTLTSIYLNSDPEKRKANIQQLADRRR
jgi:exonuclease III